jgi:cytochrome c6
MRTKKNQKTYIFSLLLLPILFFSKPVGQATDGKKLYAKKCGICHGKEGTKGFRGAKNLQTSKMEDAEIRQIIENGKEAMPAFKSKFTPEELEEVVKYAKGLQK